MNTRGPVWLSTALFVFAIGKVPSSHRTGEESHSNDQQFYWTICDLQTLAERIVGPPYHHAMRCDDFEMVLLVLSAQPLRTC